MDEQNLNELYDKYDQVCQLVTSYIYSLNRDRDAIQLRGFNWFNKEHRFLLHLAASISYIFERKVAINYGAIVRNTISKKVLPNAEIKWLVHTKGRSISCKKMLEKVRPLAQEICGETFTFADIYDAYYNHNYENL